MVKKHFKIKWSEKISFKYSWTYQNFNNPLLKCLFLKKWCCYFLFCLFSCKLCALLSFIVWWHLLCCWFFIGGMFGGYVGFTLRFYGTSIKRRCGVEDVDKPNIFSWMEELSTYIPNLCVAFSLILGCCIEAWGCCFGCLEHYSIDGEECPLLENFDDLIKPMNLYYV